MAGKKADGDKRTALDVEKQGIIKRTAQRGLDSVISQSQAIPAAKVEQPLPYARKSLNIRYELYLAKYGKAGADEKMRQDVIDDAERSREFRRQCAMESVQAAQKTQTTNSSEDMPPGNMPRTAIGKLAIKAAWEIEKKSNRKATANQVIELLQLWLNTEPILIDKIPHGVKWMTKGTKEAQFTLEACGKALAKWNKSRP